jgi:hypothetical protein
MVILNIDITVNRHSMLNSIKDFIGKAIENYIENESYAADKKKIGKKHNKNKN